MHTQRATAIDHEIGKLIREHRLAAGMRQQTLAEGVGLTYQQIHKYEQGINRISAGMLFEIAQFFGINIMPSDFFGVQLPPNHAAGKEGALALMALYREMPKGSRTVLTTIARALADKANGQ